jgi:hypothetical protein
MKTEDLLSHSRDTATRPDPEPVQSTPCLLSYFLKIRFNIILSMPRHPRFLFPSRF